MSQPLSNIREALSAQGYAIILAMQVGMNPRTLDAFVLLRGFVRPCPIALGIPPKPGKCVRQSGWRLGRRERFTEIVQGHGELVWKRLTR